MLSDKTPIVKPVRQELVVVNAAVGLTFSLFRIVFSCFLHCDCAITVVSSVAAHNEDYCSLLIVDFLLFFYFQRQTVSLQPVPKIEEVLYQYKALHVETYGPLVPELEQLGRLGYKLIDTLTHLPHPLTMSFHLCR